MQMHSVYELTLIETEAFYGLIVGFFCFLFFLFLFFSKHKTILTVGSVML